MKKYDLVIIGDGIIGKLTAFTILSNNKNLSIALIGLNNNSASKAAGAMIAVYGELENNNDFDKHQDIILDLSIQSSKKWKKIATKIDKKIITADKTIVYLKKNSNRLEKKCFDRIKKYSSFSKNNNFTNNDIKTLLLKNEFAINTVSLFDKIDSNLKTNNKLDIYNDEAKLDEKNKHVILINHKKIIKSNKILIAAGSSSTKIINIPKIVPIYHGVGTAIEMYSNELFNFLKKRTVYRTANRGGSHCGINLVPRGFGNFYLGAGNYLSKNESPFARMSTVKYLIEALIEEISSSDIVHKAKMNLVTGYRPISFDGKPLLGSPNKYSNIFIASGFNRVGLTLCPIIIEEILNWINDKKLNPIYNKWLPDREIINYGNIDYAIEAYSEYFLANLIEHKIINRNQIKKNKNILEKQAIVKHKLLQKKFKLKKDFGFNPEILSIF